MIAPVLKSKLEPIVATYRRYLLGRQLILVWAVLAVAAVALVLLRGPLGLEGVALRPLMAGVALLAGIVVWFLNRRKEIDFHWVARQIEAENPKLKTLLLAAIEQQPDPATGQLNYLQERVINDAIEENRRGPWHQKYAERLFYTRLGHLASLAILAVAVFSLGKNLPGPAGLAGTAATLLAGIEVTPGDAEVERGSGVIVLARFEGKLPAEVTLVSSSADAPSQRIPLIKTLDDPVFGGSIPTVSHDVSYFVEYDGKRTKDFKLTVFEFPRLERADAALTFPEYTGVEPKKFDNIHRISAVEGTRLDYAFTLNKAVKSATLRQRGGEVLPITVDAAQPNLYRFDLTLEESRRLDLQLVDHAGRTNKVPAEFVIDVLKNRAPEVKIAFPRGDQVVSPIEEISFVVDAFDDFGLKRLGLAYGVGGSEPTLIEIGKPSGPNEKQQATTVLSLEKLGVKPDEMISYYVWAEDIGPDGQVRRTEGDMFFAEVRPFEEIFREGAAQSESQQQREQQQGGGNNPSERLAELQKEIINATWKIKRRESGPKPGDKFEPDVNVVLDSQQSALEQAEALAQRAADNPESLAMIQDVIQHMSRAVESLETAADKKAVASLTSALSAEQAAYQALLKLAAHEFNVTRNQRNQQQGQSARNQNRQRQLQELDLEQQENRYETQRQADAQQENPEDRAQRESLARLKELAQRQQDVNERLRELQTALQEARTEKEREEVERELKRLREEQQEIVRDMDQLQQQLAQSPNQSQVADARQQLEQTRQQAAEAEQRLANQQVSQALNAGTRTQRDLEQLRDEFRRQTSSQFAEDLRQMRQQAREISQKQGEIAEKIQETNNAQARTLGDSAERRELARQMQEQKSGMTNLLENMRRVSELTEISEPVVSKRLYDTLRNADPEELKQSLDLSAELLRRGFTPQAAVPEQKAREEIERVRRGVELAAESVLGDEVEALRRAARTLDSLTSQLERDMAAGTGGGTNATAQAGLRQEASNAQNRQGTNQTQLAQAGSNSRPDGQARSNQSQPGQQPGDQPGQQEPSGQQGTQLAQAGQTGQQGQRGQQGQQGSQGQRGQQGQEGQQDGQGQQQEGQTPGQGQQPGQQPGQGQGQGQGRGQNPQQQQQQPGQGQGQGQGQGRGQNQQQQQPGQGQGQGRGQGQERGNQPPQLAQNQQGGQARGQGGTQRGNQRRPTGNVEGGFGQGSNFFDQTPQPRETGTGPLTREWSRQLSDVEEMLDQPDLRNEVARVVERSREMRNEAQRHSKPPEWDMVNLELLKPLVEVRSRIMDEIARRESKEALVQIDRDPVPAKFSERVRRYYEQLSKSE